METTGFIGGGNMAEALINGIINSKIYAPQNILVSDIKAERLEYLESHFHVQTIDSNKKLAAKADIIILSVEPQQLYGVLEDIKGSFKSDTLFISIAAGKRIEKIASYLGDVMLIRVMPNTPALIGQGACGIFAPANAKSKLDKALSIFSSVGKTFVLDREDLIDSVTACSESGPAYFFLLMENMIQTAVELGFAEDTANELVIQTAKGAALLAEQSRAKGLSVSDLRRKIVSRGGTTEAALNTFAAGGFGQLVSSALKRAYARAKELSA